MRRLLPLLCALALGACGSLSVHVDVLDPTVVDEAIQQRILREGLPTVLSQTEGDLRAKMLELQNDHFSFYVELSAAYTQEAARLGDTRAGNALAFIAGSLQEDFSFAIAPQYEATTERVLGLNREIAELVGDDPCLVVSRIEMIDYPCPAQTIAHKLKVRDSVLRDFLQQVSADMETQLSDARLGLADPTAVGRLAVIAQTAAASARKTLTMGQGLVEDPHAWAVANAPEESWSTDFNAVQAKGKMGNVNIAIKMNELGEFTLKGLTFDPGDVARVASKVASQSLLLAAQISGVPVPTQTGSGSSTTGASLATSSRRLQQEQEDQLRRDNQLEDQNQALQTIAETILREWSGLASGDANQRKRALAAIRGSYAAQKPRLQLTAAAASPAPAPPPPAPPGGGAAPTPEQPVSPDPEEPEDATPQDPAEPAPAPPATPPSTPTGSTPT